MASGTLKQGLGSFQERLARKRRELGLPEVSNGEFQLPKPNCSTCDDMGVVSRHVPVEHSDFGKLFPCPNPDCEEGNKRRQTIWHKRLKSAQVPDQYLEFTFDTWNRLSESEKTGKWLAYAACTEFVFDPNHMISLHACFRYLQTEPTRSEEVKNCLMLFGGVGTGKTGLAVATINALLGHGKSVLYVRARDLVREIQKRYGRVDNGEMPPEGVLEQFQNAPILVIDEFNMEKSQGDRSEIFESVMRHRYGHGLPTIMTANVNQQQFTEMWGERTADVVIAMAHWIPVAGSKLRRTSSELEAI